MRRLLLCLLIALPLGGCSSRTEDPSATTERSPNGRTEVAADMKDIPTALALNRAFVQAAKAVAPAVVSITVQIDRPVGNKGSDDFLGQFFPQPERRQRGIGTGSGVIFRAEGYILTNNHVVEGAAPGDGSIRVTLTDNHQYPAKLVGSDPSTDLAVIQIQPVDGRPLPVATLGSTDQLEVGEWVLAIGNPLGLTNTITAGIVSALGRNINLNNQDGFGIDNFIQTDAAINPGNSGGALVRLNGHVVGINAAIASQTGGYMGYGFAIPIELAGIVADDLIRFGRFRRGTLGVTIGPLDEARATALGMTSLDGVLVQSVTTGGAGEQAGLRPGDVITTVDGKPTPTTSALQVAIATHRPGDEVTLAIRHVGGRAETVRATLKEAAKR